MKRKPRSSLSISSLLFIGTAAWVAYSLRTIFPQLLLSGLIAYLLNPFVSLLASRTNLDRKHIVAIVFTLFITLAALSATFLTPIILTQTRILSGAMQNAWNLLPNALEGLDRLVEPNLPIESILTDIRTAANQIFSPQQAFRLLQIATGNLFWLIVVLFVSFYLLRDWANLRNWLYALAPDMYQKDIREIHQQLKIVWKTYLRGQVVVMGIVGLLSGGVAALLGLNGALLLGIIAGTLNIIPSLGPAVALAAASSIAWTTGSSIFSITNELLVFLVVVLFLMIQLVENLLIFPRVVGKRLRLHPGLILVAVISAFTLSGVMMALIIVPLISSAEVIYNYYRSRDRGGPLDNS